MSLAAPAEPLVGRATELEALDGALSRAERHAFAAVEIAGEPGIGKTRMLAELEERADRRGALVLTGAASELEADLPFWVFADALDEYVHGLEPHRLAPLGPDAGAELGHVLPSLATAPGGSPQVERYQAHRTVRALLELLAERAPLVLVLDDVHWADSGSVELLGSLLRRPPAAPVLLAMAMRPRQAPALLAAPLERARRAGLSTRLELLALTEEEAGALLGDGVPADVARRLYAESGGNPFYLEQLRRSAGRDGGAAAPLALDGLDVPPAVAASLTEELALLGPLARKVLAGAAVAGDPFEPELAAAAADAGEDKALAALDELLERDLVRPTDVPRRFRFRHPLVRAAVFTTAPAGWRLGAHERSARALAERGAPVEARAHHVEYAGRYGDAEAVRLLAEAGREVMHRTPAGAARWFAAALRLLPADAPPAERVGLLLALAGALGAAGRFEEGRAAVLEGLALSPGDAVAQRIELTVTCSLFDTLLGDHTRALARLETAIGELEQAPGPQAVTLMLHVCSNAVWRQEHVRAREWAARAYERARAEDDRGLVAMAAASLAMAGAFTGDVAEAGSCRDEAAEILDAMDDTEAAPFVGSISQLATAEHYLDRFQEGAVHAARACDVAGATNQGQLFPMLAPLHGIYQCFLGRLEASRDVLDAACEAARLAQDPHALAWVLFARAMTNAQCGDLDAALADGYECEELSPPADVPDVVSSMAGLALGFALSERGGGEEAVAHMLARAGDHTLPLVPGGWRAYWLDRLAAALLATGRREEAAAAAAVAEDVARATGLQIARLGARRAAARVALDAGDHEAAARDALAAATTADGIGAPVEAGLARLLAGSALAGAGRPDQAVGVLQEAATAFDACGALRFRDAAERELRRLGGRNVHRRTRPGRRDAAGVASLTERERQVAMLIVDRRTNPQIAAELFLSQKTVESHVRNLFNKLGVSSRVDVARMMEREATSDPVRLAAP
jgi:ATP/maltotriose-dependent transcriptional regulator MalT